MFTAPPHRAAFLCLWTVGLSRAAEPETPSPPESSFVERFDRQAPQSITGNPATENELPGTGLIGRLLHLPDDSGLRLGGLWLADSNVLLSGGADPGTWSFNSTLILGLNFDAEDAFAWPGASFGIQFLQFNGEDTNGDAGSVQGYNSLPGSAPLNRSELYQLWYRQSLFDDRLIFRIGKVVPNYDFSNVARPVPTHDEGLAIPAVTGLLYTPVYVNPTLLGAIGGYYNSVSGVTLTLAPIESTYFSYGFYDGNVARGVQTGMRGPTFNGYYFHIGEAGLNWIINERHPGQVGAGLWYQTGVLGSPGGIEQDGTGGFYAFGSQRIWSNEPDLTVAGGRKDSAPGERHPPSSISMFSQVGVNNSDTLPMNETVGLGLTGFGLVRHRPGDSLGAGLSLSWLNDHLFDRSSELMFQAYYQARVVDGVFLQPTLSFIPTPGANPEFSAAWAITLRLAVLF